VGLGFGGSGGDRVDGDPAGADLPGEDAGELLDCALGHVVDPVAGEGEPGRRAGEIDDAAGVGEAFGGEPAAVERALDVDCENGVDLLVARFGDRGQRGDGGVVDEDVDSAERLLGPLEELGELLAFADVGGDREGGAAAVS
jgi:hypothetical protein